MQDITVGMPGLCSRERIISSVFRGQRTNISVSVSFHHLEAALVFRILQILSLAFDRDWFGETAPSRGKSTSVSGGTVTISRTLACSFPRGLASWEWSVADSVYLLLTLFTAEYKLLGREWWHNSWELQITATGGRSKGQQQQAHGWRCSHNRFLASSSNLQCPQVHSLNTGL